MVIRDQKLQGGISDIHGEGEYEDVAVGNWDDVWIGKLILFHFLGMIPQ